MSKRSRSSSAATTPPQSSTSLHLSSWQYPGPSSIFTLRERAKTHTRNVNHVRSSMTAAQHTAQRAQRRAQSSNNLPTISRPYDRADDIFTARRHDRMHARSSSAFNVSASELQSPLNHHSSFPHQHPTMAHSINPVTTPAKSSAESTLSPPPYNSPQSDYFTDDNHSVEEFASQSESSEETQQLLLRLGDLQSTLMRGGHDSQALRMIGHKMSEIESDMDSLHSQSRQPLELDDSGLFMEEETVRTDNVPASIARAGRDKDGHDEVPDHAAIRREQMLLDNAQAVLHSVNKAQTELKKRFAEVRMHRIEAEAQAKESLNEIQRLRQSIINLTGDLHNSHEEVLSLRVRINHLDREISTAVSAGFVSPDMKQHVGTLHEDWKIALDSIKMRQSRHSTTNNGLATDATPPPAWKSEVCRGADGRINRLTVTRLGTAPVSVSCGIDAVHPNVDDDVFGPEPSDAATADSSPQIAGERREEQSSEETSATSSPLAQSGSTQEEGSKDASTAFKAEKYTNECAITTSSSEADSDADEVDDEPRNESGFVVSSDGQEESETLHVEPAAPSADPWQELWESLADFAGVGACRW